LHLFHDVDCDALDWLKTRATTAFARVITWISARRRQS